MSFQMRMRSNSVSPEICFFFWSFPYPVVPCIKCHRANGDGSGESARRMRRLVWAFAVGLCDKCPFHISCLLFPPSRFKIQVLWRAWLCEDTSEGPEQSWDRTMAVSQSNQGSCAYESSRYGQRKLFKLLDVHPNLSQLLRLWYLSHGD